MINQIFSRMKGGYRKGSGRKPKLDEIKVCEKFRNVMNDEDVIISLSELVRKGNIKAIELWLNYTIGRPPEKKEEMNIRDLRLPEYMYRDWTDNQIDNEIERLKNRD